jgi:hypothetical protein
MKDYHEYLSTGITQEIQMLSAALNELKGLLDRSAESIWQRDQAATIQALRLRVAEEIKREESAEASASYGFNKASLISGVAGFILGGLIGVRRKDDNPLSLGAHLFSESLDRKEPFGALVVSFKDDKGLEGVQVIPVSRLARNRNSTELEVCSSLRAKGFLLLSPQQFWIVLDRFEAVILERKLETPTNLDKELIKQAIKFSSC